VFIIYNLYPSVAFPAVDYPKVSDDPLALPIMDDAQMAIIEHNGVTKAYPLDYLIHGHIINDWFGDRLVSLTYCALCRSVIPFDVTDIGPLWCWRIAKPVRFFNRARSNPPSARSIPVRWKWSCSSSSLGSR